MFKPRKKKLKNGYKLKVTDEFRLRIKSYYKVNIYKTIGRIIKIDVCVDSCTFDVERKESIEDELEWVECLSNERIDSYNKSEEKLSKNGWY